MRLRLLFAVLFIASTWECSLGCWQLLFSSLQVRECAASAVGNSSSLHCKYVCAQPRLLATPLLFIASTWVCSLGCWQLLFIASLWVCNLGCWQLLFCSLQVHECAASVVGNSSLHCRYMCTISVVVHYSLYHKFIHIFGIKKVTTWAVRRRKCYVKKLEACTKLYIKWHSGFSSSTVLPIAVSKYFKVGFEELGLWYSRHSFQNRFRNYNQLIKLLSWAPCKNNLSRGFFRLSNNTLNNYLSYWEDNRSDIGR
jgi:hypothetical protein